MTRASPTLGAGLLRLAFHDAGTGAGGANGSIKYELARSENVGPPMKAALAAAESVASEFSVSLADAIALGGAAAVEEAGGPHIPLSLGRADADKADAPGRLPDGSFMAGDIRVYFKNRGLNDEETVALCGAHTLGRWTSFLGVSKECMDKSSADDQRPFWACTREQGQRLAWTDHPEAFNTEYFSTVAEAYKRKTAPPPNVRWKDRKDDLPRLNVLPSDLSLMYEPNLRPIVERFADEPAAFFIAFSSGYRKLVG